MTRNDTREDRHSSLKPNSIGLVGVVFMVVAFSAPITAMSGNVPIAVGYGNGIGAPAGFIIATIILTIFSIGFVALAKHITAAGAFYTFVSRGLGRPLGFGAGLATMLSYMTMEAGLVGIFSVFAQQTLLDQFGLDLPWIVYALIVIVVMSVLSYRDISIASVVLAVVLIGEIALLSIMAFAVLFHGGGPDGLMPEAINPLNAFGTNGLVAGSVGVGLLFAFWSWVGFEATAIYGEESKDPRKVIPRATLIAVIGIGVFYTFISWMMVAGSGATAAVERATTDPFSLIYYPMATYVGEWGVVAMEWFMILGAFACALAIHNSATRYLFAFGRDGLLPRALGRAHPRYQSPYIASVVQSIFAVVVVVLCAIAGVDPYAELFTLVAVFATLSILLAQVLTSAAVVNYFHVRKEHPETASWWRTFLAPIVGGIGMLYVIWLMLSNFDTATGAAGQTFIGRALPTIVVLIVVAGIVIALVLKFRSPQTYARIGRTVFDDRETEAPGASSSDKKPVAL